MAKKALLTVRVSAETKEFITAEALRFGKSIPTYLRELIDYHVSGKHGEFKSERVKALFRIGELDGKVRELEAEVRVLRSLLDGRAG